ncbi:hypothetical protein [Mesorhizobium sp. KR9-304]|uniref:hypothetical protein n=1 Tax=Mesorhizobium sp. KR9-304 TaxID=3156614 RepID=UPI0032B4E060
MEKEPFTERLLLKLCDTRVVDGLLIVGYGKSMDRVESALSLIRLHHPLRYQRLLQDVRRVWLRPLIGASGRFHQSTWTCEIDNHFVVEDGTTTEMVASVIVHEATHARLWRRGISYDERIRKRVELVCVRQELAFSAKLPNGSTIREQAESRLAYTQQLDLSNEAKRDRFGDHLEKASLDIGLPRWVVRLLMARWHRRRESARRKRLPV